VNAYFAFTRGTLACLCFTSFSAYEVTLSAQNEVNNHLSQKKLTEKTLLKLRVCSRFGVPSILPTGFFFTRK